MIEKRKPTLADLFTSHRFTLHDKYRAMVPLKIISGLQHKVAKATKYVFDDEASMRLGEVSRDIPELLVRESRFARAPYDLTWIELNSHVMWNAIYANRPDKLAMAAPDHANKIGMLIDGDMVFTVAGVYPKPNEITTHVAAFAYVLNGDPANWLDDNNNVNKVMSAFYWGSVADYIPMETLDEVSRNFGCYPVIENIEEAKKNGKLSILMDECVGDLRTIIATLLMLEPTEYH